MKLACGCIMTLKVAQRHLVSTSGVCANMHGMPQFSSHTENMFDQRMN